MKTGVPRAFGRGCGAFKQVSVWCSEPVRDSGRTPTRKGPNAQSLVTHTLKIRSFRRNGVRVLAVLSAVICTGPYSPLPVRRCVVCQVEDTGDADDFRETRSSAC